VTATPIILPPLDQQATPNQSSRHGTRIDLLVWHETAGSYNGAVSWLKNPRAQASAHLIVNETGSHAVQLVHLAEKAWHACNYNPRAVGVEHANISAKGYATSQQLAVSARIFGWLCLHLSIPPRWARGGVGPGVCYHGELGTAGCGHTQCGPDKTGWLVFLDMLHAEIARGGYRKNWAL
jgi:hypothetical protein